MCYTYMKKTLAIIRNIILIILAMFGAAFIALIIYYWPVIDRLYVRPCHYYPHAFADCKIKE